MIELWEAGRLVKRAVKTWYIGWRTLVLLVKEAADAANDGWRDA